MDDDVDVGHAFHALVAEVAADGQHGAAVEALERVAGQDLVLQPLARVTAQQDGDARVRQLADDLGQDGLAHEPGGAGQQQRLAGEPFLQQHAGYLDLGQSRALY